MNRIINSDIFAALINLDDNSIDLAITSPPYWAQRNYGFDKQIGNEETYMDYISRLVFIFNILKSKLASNGVFFLNIGDKYLKKYGKTPLGLIPYKLAHYLIKDGWVLNDTIIWYKPNHMPSSVKNRFVNSFEPVFVLSKEPDNYFTEYKTENKDYSNVLTVNLQPTTYSHIATYPEKLVSDLIDMTKIDHDYTVLDPFAGSGTTMKVIRDKNNDFFSKHQGNAVMVEYNSEYVEIIKQRIAMDNIEVIKYPYQEYHYDLISEKWDNFFDNYDITEIKKINISQNRDLFYGCIKTILSSSFKAVFNKRELLFIGLQKYTIEDIFNISQINLRGWIIRNMLVVKVDNAWFPLFMIIDDNKTSKYYFNYKKLRLNHKAKETVYKSKNYLGYKVIDNLLNKNQEGKIIDITQKYKNGLPKYVKVLWNNNRITEEYIINDEEEIQKNLIFEDMGEYLKISEREMIVPLQKNFEESNINYHEINNNNGSNSNYNGKFKDIERKNWGASPGARSSVEEEFFSMQKLYNIKQDIICDYLNYLRKKADLSKKAFTELFPYEYKHTVGHWLRKDFGGSVPVNGDWDRLVELFDIDINYTKYACKTALKLQSVISTKFKIPEDVISLELINKLELLNSD